MAVNEAEVLRQLEAQGVGANPKDYYKDFIGEIADDIVKGFKDEIKATTEGSGALSQSVVAVPKKDGFQVEADFYYKFVDEGVNAAPKVSGAKYIRPLVQNSPYSFKHLGVSKDFAKSISQYVGASIPSQYAVAVSIKKHGIKAHNITDKVITDGVLDRIAEDLATILGLTVEVIFDTSLND